MNSGKLGSSGNFPVALVILSDVLVVAAVERPSSESEVESDGEEEVDFEPVQERNRPEMKGAAEGLSVVVSIIAVCCTRAGYHEVRRVWI